LPGLSLALHNPASAATFTWASGVSANWNTANWSPAPGGLGYPTTAGDIVQFSKGAAATITLNVNATVGQLRSYNPVSGAQTQVIEKSGSFALTMDNTGGTTNDFGTTNAAIAETGNVNAFPGLKVNPDIVIANTNLDIGTKGGALTIGNSANSSAITALSGSRTLNIRWEGGNSARPITINASIGNSGSGTIAIGHVGSGSAGATTTLAGTLGSQVTTVTQDTANAILLLSGNNSYAGGTTIKQGTLALGNSATAAGVGGIFIGNSSGSSNATLRVGNNQTFANAITVQGNGGTKSIDSNTSSATPTFSGGVTLSDNLVLNNNAASSNLKFTTNAFALNGKTLAVNSNSTNASTVTFESEITGTSASAINFGGSTSAAGKFRLSAANGFSGTATINASSGGGALSLELNHANALQNATLNTGSSGNQAVKFILTGTTYNIGALAGSDALDITGSNTVSVGAKAVDSTFSGTIGNSSGTANLTKVGGNTLELSGDNSYSGATNITNGTLAVTGSGDINSTSGVTIGSSGTLRYNSSVAYSGGAITNNGGTITGTGDIGTAITLDSLADKLAPGNSPGIQEYTVAQTWGSFTYQWETNNFTGTTAGTDFDQLGITGSLTLTGAAANSYALDILSLTGSNTSGLVPNFAETNRQWTILTATGGITGFNAAYWNLNTGGFTSSPAWTGSFTVTADSNNIYLNYATVPEPGAALLGGLGTLFLLRRRRA
jgi:autotransporter-associated beta strand protein